MISELSKKLSEDNIASIMKRNIDNSNNELDFVNRNIIYKKINKCLNCNLSHYILDIKSLPYCNLDCKTNYRIFKKKYNI
jgi:hypothetical protein